MTITVPDMTRFLLSLDQAVNTVFAALREADRGETYVPDAPSVTVINLANALVGDRDIELKIVGIRPGEKMHEIMVSDEEANYSVRRGDCYAIRSMLPELSGDAAEEPHALDSEFSSADTVLDFPGTVALLKEHRLMVEDVDLSAGTELLR